VGSHRVLDHTADVGLEIAGATLEDLFEEAAIGLFALITDGPVSPTGEVGVALSAPDLESLLVRWLNELLFLQATEGWLLSAFRVAIGRAGEAGLSLEARAVGRRGGPGRTGQRREVKAATYHGLKVEPAVPAEPAGTRGVPGEGGPYRATVIFDI
jgi:SHS2 domain-containing protein